MAQDEVNQSPLKNLVPLIHVQDNYGNDKEGKNVAFQ
jgi:hypothetical protein